MLRRDRAAPLRRLARRDDHADRRARRDGRRAAAGGDDERRRRALHRGRPGADPAPARDPLPRRAAPTTSTTRSRAARPRSAERRALSVGALRATPPRSSRSCSRAASRADVVTDQTSAHDPLVGYVPAGLSLEEADELRDRDPRGLRRARPRPRLPRTASRWSASSDAGAEVFDYGNSLRARGPARRLRARLRLPRLRPRLHPAALLRGQGAVPLGRALRRSRRHRRHRPRRARRVPRGRGARRAGSGWPASGSPSRGCRRGSAGSATASAAGSACASTRWCAQRRAHGPDRDRPRPPRLRLGRLALPRDRGDARRLRRDRRLAAPERARQHRLRRVAGSASTTAAGSASGARSTPGWSCVADGTELADEKLDRVLTADPGMGVIRHADAGYDRAVEVAARARRPDPDGGGTGSACHERDRSPILAVGDPVLRQPAREVTPEELASEPVQRLIDDMIETRRAAHGRRTGGEPGRRAAADRDRRGRGDNPRYPTSRRSR